jgi:predicted O-methyltransferase YrrM
MNSSNPVLERCAKIGGWMYDDELLWLHETAKECSLVVEIGVWQGKSSTAIAMGLPENGRMFCIDSWRGSEDELSTAHAIMQTTQGQKSIFINAMDNLFEFISFGKVIPFCMKSVDACAMLDYVGEVDFVFIDGSHDYNNVKLDLEAWFPSTHENSIIAGHDFTWSGVEKAVREFFGGKVKRGPGSIWYVDRSELPS